MLAFIGRRLVGRLRRRSRWVSRALVVLGVARWVLNRPHSRAVVAVPRGTTLVVSAEQGEPR